MERRRKDCDALVEHVGDHFNLGFGSGDLLGGAGLWAGAEEEGHFGGWRLRGKDGWEVGVWPIALLFVWNWREMHGDD